MPHCQFYYSTDLSTNMNIPTEHDTNTSAYRQYKPDFTPLLETAWDILGIFAINKNNFGTPFFADDEDKRRNPSRGNNKVQRGIEMETKSIHTKYNTVLIETYSYMKWLMTSFDNLSKRLTEISGIKLHPKPQKKYVDY